VASDSNNMIYQYLRNKHNQKIGVALAVSEDDVYSIGVSVVNLGAGDWFDAARGISIAHGRALKCLEDFNKKAALNDSKPNHGFSGLTLEVPVRVIDQVKDFDVRASRYFKDKAPAVIKVEASTITMNFEKSVQELTSLFETEQVRNKKEATTPSLREEAKKLAKVGQALEVISKTDTHSYNFQAGKNMPVQRTVKT